MTVESTSRKQTFAGGQSALTFSFRTLANHPEYIQVKNTVVATGVETDLVYNTDYTVSLESDGTGGTVTLSPTFSTAYNHTVYRSTTDKQESDYDDFNQFPANTVESDFDRRTLISQERAEDSARTAKLPISSTITDVVLPTPVDGKALVWSGTNGTLINATLTDLGLATLDTDGTLAANSDLKVPTQKAVRTFLRTNSTGNVNVIFDGGGAVLTTGIKADVTIPFACTITGVTVLANTGGSLVIDIWKDTYANYPPTVADTITASAKPTLSTAMKYSDTTLTGWTVAVAAGDTLRFNIDSVSTISRALISLNLTKTT